MEKGNRLDRVLGALTGVNKTDTLEPGPHFIDLMSTMVEDASMDFLEWGARTSREHAGSQGEGRRSGG